VYDGLHDAEDDGFDAPSPMAAFRNRVLFIPQQAARRGSRVHLTGFGGDELLAGSPAHLHAMLRTHPRLALRHARGFATQRPWRYRETLRQLMDHRSYSQWLARAADQLTASHPPPDTPTLDWGTPPRMPRWATPDAVDAVRERIAAAARSAEPLAQQRGQHVELEAMRAVSRTVRHVAQTTAGLGLTLAAPYYDDRVIEAGLAVRPQDRITPWRYKPLIVEAMRGIVPEESLTRSTKDEGSYEVEDGLRQHRGELLALFEESRLARLGLIDADALREVCSRPLPPSVSFTALYQTVACEVWLRSRERVTISAEETQ
jgi:asparagine synthase (glutamine-hydrolysing)